MNFPDSHNYPILWSKTYHFEILIQIKEEVQTNTLHLIFFFFQVFDVAVNQHTVIKGLDIYERVGRGVGHDEYIPFRVNNNQLLINGETLPFGGSVYVEFLKVGNNIINFYNISHNSKWALNVGCET